MKQIIEALELYLCTNDGFERKPIREALTRARELEAEIERYRDALEFYCDAENWHWDGRNWLFNCSGSAKFKGCNHAENSYPTDEAVHSECGFKAKQALQTKEQEDD